MYHTDNAEPSVPPPSPFLTLLTFEVPLPNTPSLSPFVAKLHFRLIHGGLAFDVRQAARRSDAPKGKMPFVQVHERFGNHDDDTLVAAGTMMGDSAVITGRLVEAGKLPDLNARLTPVEKARDLAIRALVEDRMNFLVVRERYIENWDGLRCFPPFSAGRPWGLRHAYFAILRIFVSMMLHFQGTGRYDRQEWEDLHKESFEALNALLEVSGQEGGGWVLGGHEPTEADFALFGMLAAFRGRPMHPQSNKILMESSALRGYMDRILRRYYPEWKFEDAESK